MKNPPVSPLQETFLNDLILKQRLVSVYLKSSIRLKGFLITHNAQSIFLKNSVNSEIQMIYKNAVSTISPERIFEQYES